MLHSHYSMIIFFIQLFCYAQFSSASNLIAAKEKASDRIQSSQHADFVISLPKVTTTEVLQEINNTRLALKKRRAALSKAEKESSFSTKDGAISLILPGGLLYAAIIKLRHINAKKRLRKVTRQLDELDRDLISFRSSHIGNTLLATLP